MMQSNIVAVYLRLSMEDGDIGTADKEESNSIQNQRVLLNDYIEKQPELKGCTIREYCDDGFSGTNFNRPAFTRMMEDAKNGELSCIIVKDYSRLGRDYIEVGSYMELIFPMLQIQFIAVNEHYDSMKKQGATGGMNVALKNLVNMMYSRDLSRKVKGAHTTRVKSGKCINGFAKYGYMKSPEDKYQLIVDPEAAVIVRLIFEMAAEEVLLTDIARHLNQQNIPTPVEYKRIKKIKYYIPKKAKIPCWSVTTIQQMLVDEIYIGNLVWNKCERSIDTGKRSVLKDRSEWLIVPNTHEPIVSRELFEKANQHIKKNLQHRARHKHSINLFICGYCGRTMAKYGNKSLACQCYKTADHTACGAVKISVEDVQKSVVSAVNIMSQTLLMKVSERKKALPEKEMIKEQLNVLEHRSKKIASQKIDLYHAYRTEKISREEFLKVNEQFAQQTDADKQEKVKLEMKMKQLESGSLAETEKELNSLAALKEFDSQAFSKIIENVKVYGKSNIEIVWKSEDTFLSA